MSRKRPHLAITTLALLIAIGGCHSQPLPKKTAKPATATTSEPWDLATEFPGATTLYEQARGQHLMRGYELPGITKDSFRGPIVTTDVGPDPSTSLSMRELYERRIASADPRPGSSSRLISSDSNSVIFEQRYDGPPSMPDVKFVSVMRAARPAGQNKLAWVSYVAEAQTMTADEVERIAAKLGRLQFK